MTSCMRAFRHLSLVAGLLITTVVAHGGETLQLAPANPRWAEYQADMSRPSPEADFRHRVGIRPSPFLHPGLKLPGLPVREGDLPASYDLRTIAGKVPPIRNQRIDGPCWTFATLASLETCLRPGDTFDASENNLKNRHGFDAGPLDGGDYWMAAAYLARWSGPVSESDDPYRPRNGYSPPNLPCRRHVQDVTYLPDRANFTDNALIKQFIMDRGALYCGMNWADRYMNYDTCAMYNPYKNLGGGHAVAAIGWDDNYPVSNFRSPRPPGPGAFLIRDSEGKDFLPDGCFWISYYDKSLCEFVSFTRAEALNNYGKQYSYDPLGWVNEAGIAQGLRRAYFANIFRKGDTAETLQAVATYATAPNTSYEVRIYLNPSQGPVGGDLVSTQTGTFAYAGFHTVVLNTPVTLTETDTSFSVVFHVTNPAYNYLMPLEFRVFDYSSAAAALARQSYYSSDGNAWTDATKWKKTCNVCVKAYTNTAAAQ